MPAGERDAGAGERRGARADGRVVAAGRAMHDEALVTDAHVCFTCDNGLLYTLDRATGREVWRQISATRRSRASCCTRCGRQREHA